MSLNGTCAKPSGQRLEALMVCRIVVAASAPSVRPWNEPCAARMTLRFFSPRRQACFAGELDRRPRSLRRRCAEETVSNPDSSASRSASIPAGS